MATSTLIQFTRGDGYLSDAFPQLPAATDVPMYDGVTIIKDISSGTPWVNSLTNQLFVGNACINPFLEASDPISVTADYYVGGTTPDDAYIATKLQLNSNSNHFSISNGVLNLNLDSSDFITNSSGVHINWPSPTTYTLPSANTTTLGGIKPSWSGVVTDLEDVFDHKATTIAALATSENKYYPVISDPSSLLNITNDYPYSLFETAAARDGRLYTVTRPATRKFSGSIKVSPPLSGNNSTDMFPGTGITFTFLDGSSTGNVGIHTKNAYLARLTNRADLLSNNVVDLDTLLGQSAYPSASNQTLAQRDSLFETFVPIPWPSTAHPGISKISGGNSFSIGNLITPTGSYIYPIGITTTNQLVAQLPNVLVASNTVPSSGDLVLYDPNEGWDPRKPARLTLKVNNAQVASYGVEDSTDSTVNLSIPDAVSGTNDGTNWTSITIGSVTKNIPSGGGGGGTISHDYTHSSVSVVSTSTTTVTFAANQKCTKYISVSDDIDIAFVVNNFASNYLWVINTSNNDIDVTFSLASNSTLGTILNYHMPEDPLTISAGKEAEIGIIVNADGAFITYRSDLVKTSFLQATVNVSSSNSSYGTATLTGGPTYTFESGSTQSVTMTASPASGCFFIKWQSSSNGTTWTDVSGGTNPTLTTTLNASGTYYYKAVFSTGTSISAVEARILTPNGSSEAKVFLGNNYEDSITVSPGTTIYLSTDGYPIDFSYTSYPDLSNYSDFVVGYEYSTNNGSTWNFVSINDSSFSAGSIATIVRPIVASEVYLMELTATSMGDSSMGTIGSDSVSIDVSVEGNFVSSPTLDYYNANLYIPVFDGESIYFTASFSPCSQPGNFYVGDSQGNSVNLDYYGSTSEQIYFGDGYDYSTGTQWTTDSCTGSLTIGYDENPDPNDPNDPNNPGGGY